MSIYEDIRVLGKGGFAQVWLCKRKPDDAEFAKKVVIDESDTDGVARFVREIKLLQRLDHPHIVKVVDAQLDCAPYYYVMPRYRASLQDHVSELGGDEDRIHEIFGRILDALEHAHSQGVIHRDIKPANVLMNSDTDLVISDFGLGRALDSSSTRKTGSGAGMGTPLYMAPEQWTNAKAADQRADVFALGQLLLDMYIGTIGGLPGPGSIPTEVMLLINTCLVRDPARRFQSVSQLREAWDIIRNPQRQIVSAQSLVDTITFDPVSDTSSGGGSESVSPFNAARNVVQVRVARFGSSEHPDTAAGSALAVLENVAIAGPRQPDFGLTPRGIAYLQDFVSQWENRGELRLWATLNVGFACADAAAQGETSGHATGWA